MSSYHKKKIICQRIAQFKRPQANAKLVAKNTFILYLRMLVVMCIGLFTGRVLLRALGVNDYGYQGVAGAVIGMFTFIQGSLATASSRFLTVEMGKGTPGSIKRTFSTILIVHFILAVIFVVLLETVGLIVLETKLNIDPSRIFACKWVYQCGVVSVFLGVTQVPYGAIIVAHERMNAFAWMTIYDVVVKLAITMSLMCYSGDRLILNATLWLISGITTIMIYRVYCVRNFSEARFRKVFDRKLLKPVFSFAGWQISAQTVLMLLGAGITMINQRYFGPAIVAAIAIAQTVNGHVQNFIGNFKTASIPQIVKLYADGQYTASKNMLINMVHISVYLFLVLGAPIFAYSTEALTIWLGDSVPEHSPIFVKFIMLGTFFYLYETSFYQVFYAAGRIRENAIINFIIGVGAFISAFVLVHITRNIFVTSIMLMVYHILQGMVGKPFLAWQIAGYKRIDFIRIYLPTLSAFVICGSVAFGVKWLMPQGLVWAIPSCVIIVLLNLSAIYLLVASDAIRNNINRIVANIPIVGKFVANILVASSVVKARVGNIIISRLKM